MFDRTNVNLAREYQVPLALRSMHEPYSNEHCHPFARFWREGICFPRSSKKQIPKPLQCFQFLSSLLAAWG